MMKLVLIIIGLLAGMGFALDVCTSWNQARRLNERCERRFVELMLEEEPGKSDRICAAATAS